MKYLIIFVSLVFLATKTSVHAQKTTQNLPSYNKDKKYSIEELHFDLEILKDALVKTHPGLFWYQTEKEFEDNFINLKNCVNRPMTDLEFYMLVTPFVGKTKCGHTDVFIASAHPELAISEDFGKRQANDVLFFPFNIRIINSKIYISKNLAIDTAVLVNSKILAINGLNTDSIILLMQPHQWTDGFTKSYTRMEFVFPTLLLSIFNFPDSYILQIIDPSGMSRTVRCEALNATTIAENNKRRYTNNSNNNETPFGFRIIDSLQTGVLKIDQFMGKGYEKFLANSFKTIKDKTIKNLIIDLRGNAGGDGHYSRLLYSYIATKKYTYYDHLEVTIDNPKDSIFDYGRMPFGKTMFRFFHATKLKKTENGKFDLKYIANKEDFRRKLFNPKRTNFAGNVYVLIDVKSYSSSAEFAAIAHYNKRAKFIGRETGGGYCGNTSGLEFILTLPNTGILTFIPLIKFYMAVEGSCGRGIQPDYSLKEDLFDKDADLLFTLDLINQSK